MRSTRSELLAAARAELLEKGWDDISGEGIRKRAGVSQGSWTHFFPQGKVQIAAEIFEELHAQIWTTCLDRLNRDAALHPWVTLGAGIDTLIEAIDATPVWARILFDLEHVLARSSAAEQVRARVAVIHAALARWLSTARLATKTPPAAEVLYALLFTPVIALARDSTCDGGRVKLMDLRGRLAGAARHAIEHDPSKSSSAAKASRAEAPRQPELI